MPKYFRPKKNLHREFLYMDNDTIVNSLSALEAGKIDEIIQKANEARDGGFSGGVRGGGIEASGGKRKSSVIEEELVITRTTFSAFHEWYTRLAKEEAFGKLEGWDEPVSRELSVGDTLEFTAKVTMAPLHLMVRSFLSFAQLASDQDSPLAQNGAELKDIKKQARQVSSIAGLESGDNAKIPVYLAPFGVEHPRVLASLSEKYIVRNNEEIDGTYQVIAQVDRVLDEGEEIAVSRFFSGAPPTPLELRTISEAWLHMVEPAAELGVEIDESDITVRPPAVVVRPIAIYR